MTSQKLTQVRIERLRPKPKRYQIPDPECPGLYVRVTPAGGKTFTVVARDPAGKQIWREVKGALIGDPLDDVRDKAREGIRRIKLGQVPFPPPPQKPDAFGEVAKNWLRLHVEAKGLRSRSEIERLLNSHILPLWRNREFEDIRRSDVTRLLDGIVKDHGARQADYVLAIVRGIMNWHATRVDDYIVPIVRGMGRRSAAESARKRILTDDELRALWPALDASGSSFGALVKLLLLTGQRREKVAAMRWADIAVDGVWTIPSEDREKGNARELALPQMAVDIIRSLPRVSGNDYVFAGRTAGYFGGFSRAKTGLDERAEIAPWVLHDLRRTARSLMSRAGVRPDIAERVLGHVIAGVEGVYDRHSYFDEKKDAVARFAALLGRILNPPAENVVELAGRG